MTDSELLELAAKAAGAVKTEQVYSTLTRSYIKHGYGLNGFFWNPRDDDGDSRRLQVKLKIDLSFGTNYAMAYHIDSDSVISFVRDFDKDGSAESAARMAVLMVAAEIGRGMV
jgi:hypothetical protein